MHGNAATRYRAAAVVLSAWFAAATAAAQPPADLTIAGATVRVDYPAGEFRHGNAQLLDWVRRSGSIVAAYYGRNFTGTGPTAEQIAAFTGSPALEPIRAYAGIASAADMEDRARLAVADLRRAGGFDREYLLVAGTTGTGWVDPGAIDSLEYLTGGNVASVAIQYSYLPSWVSFIVDQTRARQAGRAMFDAVAPSG